MYRFSVATEFSRTPGPRYENEGTFSGQSLRKRLLPLVKRALNSNERLLIDLDGTAGYGTSFLEEVFGGMIRNDGLDMKDLAATISFKSDEEDYLIEDIKGYWADATEIKSREKRRHE